MISLLGVSKFDAVSKLGKLSVKELITKRLSDQDSSDESDLINEKILIEERSERETI